MIIFLESVMRLRKQALLFFLLPLMTLNNVKSQGYYKGFYTGSYKEAKGDDDLSNTKKEFCIIFTYNSIKIIHNFY
jgi:hypothetical protein